MSGNKKLRSLHLTNLLSNCKLLESLLLRDCAINDTLITDWMQQRTTDNSNSYCALSYINLSNNLITLQGVATLLQYVGERLSVLVIRGCPYANKLKLEEVVEAINPFVTVIKE
jgi:hypothetical protein